MKTYTVQIGNSDDKLTQVEYSRFVRYVRNVIDQFAQQMHFSGASPGDEPWQNKCWVFNMDEAEQPEFYAAISRARADYKQESVAITAGDTTFV